MGHANVWNVTPQNTQGNMNISIKASICLMSLFIHPKCLLLIVTGCGSLHKISFLGKPLTISSRADHTNCPRPPFPVPCKHVTVNAGLLFIVGL